MKLEGRKFMVVTFSVTTCTGWLYALYAAPPDAKGAVFGTMFGLVTMIAQAYFGRSDRKPEV